MSEPEPATHPGGRPRDPGADGAFIEAVLDLVGEGATLSGLSLVTIADRAGISRNSLYRRWRTKEALYLDVLASINQPLPQLEGRSAREVAIELLTLLAERARDERASRLLCTLNAETEQFPDLHRRYFETVVEPRRQAMNAVLRRGVEGGEVRADVDPDFVSEVLVAPILARSWRHDAAAPGPRETGRRIVDLVFAGAAPRAAVSDQADPGASSAPRD